MKAWYDSDPVRFFFFREKLKFDESENPILPYHGTAIELLTPAFLAAFTMAGITLTMIMALIYGYFGFWPAVCYFGVIPTTLIEALHYRYDRCPY